MNFAKKATVGLALALALTAFIAGTAFAAEVIGCIEPQKIMFQHPKFEQVQKQVKDVLDKKQRELKAAIDQEPNEQKKSEIFNKMRQEAANEERKLMEPLFRDINLAIRTVANTKNITVVLDKSAIFYGGINITDDVIRELKKN